MSNKIAVVLGGGTISHVRPHLAICAPAYGTAARQIAELIPACSDSKAILDVHLHLTAMAGGSPSLSTAKQVGDLLKNYVANPLTKIIFMSAAMVDFDGFIDEQVDGDPNDLPRLTSSSAYNMTLVPAAKAIASIRKERKDIFLVGFKHTRGATADEQYVAGLRLCKQASCNLVLANDTKTRLNMVITPEESRYHQTTDRGEALKGLVEMAIARSHLTFTRSTVVAGESVSWDSDLVPETLRKVVNHCINSKAYKPFGGATVGHFAAKIGETTFLTSKRKTDFNKLSEIGLVRIETDGPDSVIAYGSKPSVGGQSQRIVFHDHREYDCIVHFHSPKRPTSDVPTVSQREYECGSHQCGKNTSDGLKKFGNLSAVYLDQHGPNIVFHKSIDPQEVIRFIDENFDLSQKTGGHVS